MNYINAGKLRSFLENVPSNSYVAVGTRENNEIEEIRQECMSCQTMIMHRF